MEPDQDKILDISQRTGLDEHEARIFHYLIEAGNLYWELVEQDDYGTKNDDWSFHQNGLFSLLMYRIVRRDHPEGWLTVGEVEEREEAEKQDEADSSP